MSSNYKLGERAERPWGWWRVDEVGQGFIKKTISVNVNGCLSLQSHNHRAEKWEIVQGKAEITIGDKVQVCCAAQTVEIPLKAIHRLKNVGIDQLVVKETQLGEILDENDIIRYEDVYGRDKAIFLADMDGTLTPARQPMTEEFAEFFLSFIKTNIFYVVSGSDLKKVREQMPKSILEEIDGLFCSMGNEFYIRDQLIYRNDFNPEKDLLERLENYRKNTIYDGPLFDNYIERRQGMLNFSVLGRNCSHEQRAAYKKWDDVHSERKRIARELAELYPQYDISVGGNISIDIVPHGLGKEQVAAKVREKFPQSKIFFIGDRTKEGGNDYSLAQALLQGGNAEVIAVNGPDDTLKFLREKCN